MAAMRIELAGFCPPHSLVVALTEIKGPPARDIESGVMRRRLPANHLRLVLAILYGIAMALLPLAHRAATLPTGTGAAPPDPAAYALPDGKLPMLCLSGGDGSGKTSVDAGCPACTLTAAAGLLPVPAAGLGPHDRHDNRAAPPPASRVVVHLARDTARPRDPPRPLA